MILYHGTTYNNFKSIFNMNEISTTTDQNSHYPDEGIAKTTRGYVYLTDSPLAALEFATKAWLASDGKDTRLLVVIKINVDENDLEEDLDEKIWHSSSVENSNCYRIKRPINYNNEVCDLAFFQFESYQSSCDYFDYKTNESIIWLSNETKWNGDITLMSDKILQNYK